MMFQAAACLLMLMSVTTTFVYQRPGILIWNMFWESAAFCAEAVSTFIGWFGIE